MINKTEYKKALKVVENYEKQAELEERAKERQKLIDSLSDDLKYTVREYDYFDNLWFDLKSSVSKKEAIKEWDKHTKNGTERTKYEDKCYVAIFQADTRMLRS
jgi:predicted DNA-binding protein YlxM (UPF0122 family)